MWVEHATRPARKGVSIAVKVPLSTSYPVDTKISQDAPQTSLRRKDEHTPPTPGRQQAAESANADTPMGQLAQALYARFVEEEDGKGRDFSAMLPRFEKRNREG